MIDDEEYIENHGCICPVCGSKNILTGLYDDETKTLDMSCADCKQEWFEILKIYGYELKIKVA